MDAAQALAAARTLVVKVGSSLAASEEAFSFEGLAEDIARRGGDTLVVTSGAVAFGRQRLALKGAALPERQALSAAGQTALMRCWEDALAGQGRVAAQLLLTPDVTDDRARYLNARAAIRSLLTADAVPVINENDAVTTAELRYGDNDGLAARVAGLVDADLLVLLSDVDGLYTGDPRTDAGAGHISLVPAGEAASLGLGATARGSGVGTGGMRSKVAAARLATGWGVPVIVASGRTARPLSAIAKGARCTLFEAGPARPARQRWLAGTAGRQGAVEIDEGAARALSGGASLLAVGVTAVPRAFRRGELVEVLASGTAVAFGLAATDSDGLDGIVLHKDDLVVI